jgi:hypothetical protein
MEVDILEVDILEIDILEIDILGIYILEVDILEVDTLEVDILELNILEVDILEVDILEVDTLEVSAKKTVTLKRRFLVASGKMSSERAKELHSDKELHVLNRWVFGRYEVHSRVARCEFLLSIPKLKTPFMYIYQSATNEPKCFCFFKNLHNIFTLLNPKLFHTKASQNIPKFVQCANMPSGNPGAQLK